MNEKTLPCQKCWSDSVEVVDFLRTVGQRLFSTWQCMLQVPQRCPTWPAPRRLCFCFLQQHYRPIHYSTAKNVAAREKHPKCRVAKDWSLNTSFWIFDNAFKCECRVEHHWLLAFDHLLVNCVIEVSNLKCRQVFVSSTITISQPVLARLQKKLCKFLFVRTSSNFHQFW